MTVLTSSIPTLATERLILRGLRLDDYAVYTEIWRDPDVIRFIGGRPFTAEETWARLLRHAGLWSLLGCGFWGIEEAATGRLIGEIGFADFGRDIEPSLRGRREQGWALVPAAHGRGLAGEAMTAVLDWGRANLGVTETVCIIDGQNAPSIRLAERFGYAAAGVAQYRGMAMQLFRRPMPT